MVIKQFDGVRRAGGRNGPDTANLKKKDEPDDTPGVPGLLASR
jgi:hypothetical protein